MANDHYATLGIGRQATTEEIKRAYRKLAMRYHPDRNQGDKEKEAKLKTVNEAYDVLSDTEKRTDYDRTFPFKIPETKKSAPAYYASYSPDIFR